MIAALSIRGLTKRFGGHVAVDDVSFEVPSGSFFAILGPSGCGKTTLMRMIAGFQQPDAGDVLVGGRSMRGVPPNKRPVNMVFQNLALFPTMSVGGNVAYGLKCRKEPKADIAVKVRRVLERVGLAGFEDRHVDRLSGGQRQRVAIARCLVLEPSVLLLDEPLGALDLKLREQMKIELKRLQSAFGTTFVYITHDQSEALVMSDRVAVMNRGRFDQVGDPRSLYHEPQTAFVAAFVGDSNRFDGTLAARDGDRITMARPGLAPIHGRGGPDLVLNTHVAAFVRPETIALAVSEAHIEGCANRYPARVEAVLFDGSNSRLLLAVEGFDDEIRAALPQAGALAGVGAGQALWIGWPENACRCFAETVA
ncbi:MAG: ABC transporter ATP-binding protein [Hyphomicrobiaceae bacterium]